VPVSLGRQHVSKTAAHRSYTKVFQFLSIVSFILYWTLVIADFSSNIPREHHNVLDVFKNSVGLSTNNSLTNRVLSGISITAQRLKNFSKHPIISVTSTDVLFTVISLLTWTFIRDLDVDSILENSVLAFLVPKHEKHVAFEDDAHLATDLQPEPEPLLETTTPRKRGRPAKDKPVVNGPVASSTGSSRRSTRTPGPSADIDSDAESTLTSRKPHGVDYESDADSTYQPSSTIKREIAETETDGTSTASDLVQSGESTALALFLAFAGGVGQLAAGALGAEVTGPRV
jgi:hypothetical protein